MSFPKPVHRVMWGEPPDVPVLVGFKTMKLGAYIGVSGTSVFSILWVEVEGWGREIGTDTWTERVLRKFSKFITLGIYTDVSGGDVSIFNFQTLSAIHSSFNPGCQ